ARHAVGNTLKTSAVGEERVAVIVPAVAPRIAAAFGEHFEPIRGRIEPPDAATVETHHAVRRLDVCVGVDGLVHVDVPVVTPAQRVQIVVRVLGAKTGKNDALLVRFAIAVCVLEIQQLMAGGDVTTLIAVGQDAGGNEQAVGEHGGFVGFAVAIGVFEHNDGIGGGLARLDLRIHLGTGD